MIEVYKLLQGKYDSDVSDIIKLHKDSVIKEGRHSLKLLLERAGIYEKKASHLVCRMVYLKKW